MNVLFLSIGDIPSIKHREIYPDLLREFTKCGHKIYVVCAREKRKNLPTELVTEENATLLKLRIGNITKTNVVEKGISTILVNMQYKRAIKEYFADVKFDLILYSTPPITLVDCIAYVKKRDNAKTYLLLKDIFPQNAVDLGMISKTGLKGILYRYFRDKEAKLYKISDYIGCMSPANVRFVIDHNPEINPSIVEVCPNSIDIIDMRIDEKTKSGIRNKYDIPTDRTVFVYGGNLGKPQGIDFVLQCLQSQMNNHKSFFVIIGDGTEYGKIHNFVEKNGPSNVKLMRSLPRDDYDRLVSACDVGMIFLDHRFTIPNFPSRLLAYMQAGLPVLACTDPNTDIGTTITDNHFGWWCESNSVNSFDEIVYQICNSIDTAMCENSFQTLKANFMVSTSYEIIMRHFTH